MPKIPEKALGLKEVIAMQILKYRERAGLSQKELGITLGFKEENAQAQIYQYERGLRSPGKRRLEQIAEILNVPVDVLLVNTSNVYRATMVSEETTPYASRSAFDKELQLFKEEAKKYGPEGVRLARELMPVIMKSKIKRPK